MVCRENKGRSVAIRYAKELAKALGIPPMHDRELQSEIHCHNHDFAGAPDLTEAEQIALWQGVKQQIENDLRIPAEEKYRISDDQPGMVTRIDEEIQRLRDGYIIDRNGRKRPLEAKNRNTGAQIQAIQHLGTRVPELHQAKEEYFEIYARHTGCTVPQARAKWNEIMARTGEGRGNVGISLRDNWKDDLAVAGLSAERQSGIGQSARARAALEEMEAARHAALEASPRRDTIRPEHRRFYSSSGSNTVQCVGGCGQFGHTADQCPNGDLLAKRGDLRDQHNAAFSLYRAAEINNYLTDGQATDPAERARLEAERDRNAAGRDIPTLAAATDTLRRIDRENRAIDDQFAERAPKVSSWVQEIAYSEESGLLRVTTKDRTRKDGSVSPATAYNYRVPKAEADRILAHPDVGVALNESVMRRGRGHTNDGYHWENAADEKAALEQRKCPTCGQWASMTSSHRCPVEGAVSADADRSRRARLAMWQREVRAARADGVEPPEKPMPRMPLTFEEYKSLSSGGVAHVPRARTVAAITDNGQVAAPAVRFQYPDAEVTGQATVWQDPDGRRLVSPRKEAGGTGMRCTCAAYRANGDCPHIKSATVALGRHVGAHPIGDRAFRPGVSAAEIHRDRTSDTSFDAPKTVADRMNYGRIRQYRTRSIDNHVAGLGENKRRGVPINGPVLPPTDAEGNETSWPTEFSRDRNQSDATDLNDTDAVQRALRRGLFSRNREHYSVIKGKDGSLVITVPPKRRDPNGKIPRFEREKLAQAMNLPVSSSRSDGIHVPNDPSWRHMMLSRAYGDEPSINAARYTIA